MLHKKTTVFLYIIFIEQSQMQYQLNDLTGIAPYLAFFKVNNKTLLGVLKTSSQIMQPWDEKVFRLWHKFHENQTAHKVNRLGYRLPCLNASCIRRHCMNLNVFWGLSTNILYTRYNLYYTWCINMVIPDTFSPFSRERFDIIFPFSFRNSKKERWIGNSIYLWHMFFIVKVVRSCV